MAPANVNPEPSRVYEVLSFMFAIPSAILWVLTS